MTLKRTACLLRSSLLCLLLILLGFIASLTPASLVYGEEKTGDITLESGSEGEERTYSVSDSSYTIYLNDEENLLTAEEEENLIQTMKPITRYGHVAFMTTQIMESDYEKATGKILNNLYGLGTSGTIFLIDMNHRQLVIFSDGEIYKIISKKYASTITDNVYKMAKKGDYYGTATEVYSEMMTLLSGHKIAEPMRHITNAMLAIILSTMLLYFLARGINKKSAANAVEILAMLGATAMYSNSQVTFNHKQRTYNPRESGGGGGGFSGGGGGGGSSGGGGSHGF